MITCFPTQRIEYTKTIMADGESYKCTGTINFTMVVYYTGEYYKFSNQPADIEEMIKKYIVFKEGILLGD